MLSTAQFATVVRREEPRGFKWVTCLNLWIKTALSWKSGRSDYAPAIAKRYIRSGLRVTFRYTLRRLSSRLATTPRSTTSASTGPSPHTARETWFGFTTLHSS